MIEKPIKSLFGLIGFLFFMLKFTYINRCSKEYDERQTFLRMDKITSAHCELLIGLDHGFGVYIMMELPNSQFFWQPQTGGLYSSDIKAYIWLLE